MFAWSRPGHRRHHRDLAVGGAEPVQPHDAAREATSALRPLWGSSPACAAGPRTQIVVDGPALAGRLTPRRGQRLRAPDACARPASSHDRVAAGPRPDLLVRGDHKADGRGPRPRRPSTCRPCDQPGLHVEDAGARTHVRPAPRRAGWRSSRSGQTVSTWPSSRTRAGSSGRRAATAGLPASPSPRRRAAPRAPRRAAVFRRPPAGRGSRAAPPGRKRAIRPTPARPGRRASRDRGPWFASRACGSGSDGAGTAWLLCRGRPGSGRPVDVPPASPSGAVRQSVPGTKLWS